MGFDLTNLAISGTFARLVQTTGGLYYDGTGSLLNIGTGSGGASSSLRVYDVTVYGAKGDGVTDDTTAIQSAINACGTNGGGTVYFPFTNNPYIIGGPILTSSAGVSISSSQLYIPFVPYASASQMGSIRLLGEIVPNAYTDYSSGVNQVPTKMVILQSALTSSVSGSIIGSTYSSIIWGNFNYMDATFENLCFRVNSKSGSTHIAPTMGAIDASPLGTAAFYKVRCDTMSPQVLSVAPASSSFGIKTPALNNFAHTKLEDVLIQNYSTGLTVDEHVEADELTIATCYYAIKINNHIHASLFNRCLLIWNVENIKLLAGNPYFKMNQLDIETYPGSGSSGGLLTDRWFNTQIDLDDTSGGGGAAEISYHRVIAAIGVSQSLTTNTTNPNIVYSNLGYPLHNFYDAQTPGVTSNTLTVGFNKSQYGGIVINADKAAGLGGSFIAFKKNAAANFQLGEDFNADGTKMFYLYDYQNSRQILTVDPNSCVGVGNTLPTAFLDVLGSTTSHASLRVRSGSAPTSPNTGDVWLDSTGSLKFQINGTTQNFLFGSQMPRYYNVVTFGGDPSGIADSTKAIQTAINSCSFGGGGTVWFPNGIYMVSGSLITSDNNGKNPNSQIYIPDVSSYPGAKRCSIKIQGESNIIYPSDYTSASSGVYNPLQTTGVIIKSTLTSSSGSAPAVWGTIGSGSLSSFNFSDISFEDITTTVYTNSGSAAPVLSAYNFFWADAINMKRTVACLDCSNTISHTPEGSEVAGFMLSSPNNRGPNIINSTWASGFKYGYLFGEHTQLQNVFAFACRYGLVFPTVFYVVAGQVQPIACPHPIYFPTSSIFGYTQGPAFVNLITEEENDGPGVIGSVWYNVVNQIHDPNNNGRGTINIHFEGSGLARDENITINGGSFLSIIPFDAPTMVQYISPGFGETDFQQNVYWDGGNYRYRTGLMSASALQLFQGSMYFTSYAPGTTGSGVSAPFRMAYFNSNGQIGLHNNLAPTSWLDLAASTTNYASMRILSGSAPTSPNTGDIWLDSTGSLKIWTQGGLKTITLS